MPEFEEFNPIYNKRWSVSEAITLGTLAHFSHFSHF